MADDAKRRVVFVTVGTTSFDRLIEVISSDETCQILKRLGYTEIHLQIGRGAFEPKDCTISGFHLECFRYRDSIKESIEQADLVISHAGAGSVLETLSAGCPLLVVINEDLMDNHQIEVAQQLSDDGHLYYTTPSKLKETLQTMDISKLKPFVSGQPSKFASFLDRILGYS